MTEAPIGLVLSTLIGETDIGDIDLIAKIFIKTGRYREVRDVIINSWALFDALVDELIAYGDHGLVIECAMRHNADPIANILLIDDSDKVYDLILLYTSHGFAINIDHLKIIVGKNLLRVFDMLLSNKLVTRSCVKNIMCHCIAIDHKYAVLALTKYADFDGWYVRYAIDNRKYEIANILLNV